jgi:hypothetical protein
MFKTSKNDASLLGPFLSDHTNQWRLLFNGRHLEPWIVGKLDSYLEQNQLIVSKKSNKSYKNEGSVGR